MRKVFDLKTRIVTEELDAPVTPETAEQQAMRLAAIAEQNDKMSTIADPIVSAIANMTRAEIATHIDNEFDAMNIQQRRVLKALALAARFAIRKGL